jgi:2'-5' RNA ligase
VRAFIAVQLPVELRARLTTLQGALRSLPIEAAWVRETAFHITLRFLGEIRSVDIKEIASCMGATVQDVHPFPLTLCGVGVFPHESAPRVLWVGIQDATGLLSHVHRRLEAQLTRIGYTPERHAFTPHLTLARIRRVSGRAEFESLLKTYQQVMIGQLTVGCIALIESQLHPSGARYATVKAMSLGAVADCAAADASERETIGNSCDEKRLRRWRS